MLVCHFFLEESDGTRDVGSPHQSDCSCCPAVYLLQGEETLAFVQLVAAWRFACWNILSYVSYRM